MDSVDPAEDRQIPLIEGLLLCLLYLALHMFWSRTVHGPYSFAILRIGFIAALVVLWVWRWRVPIDRVFGKFSLPSRANLTWCAVFLAALLAARLLLHYFWFGSSDSHPLYIHSFFDECILAPVNEELVFRGFFLTCLLRALSPKYALPFSALIFVSVHNFGVYQILSLFTGGMFFGVAFTKTRSITYCMLLHAAWNAVVFLP